MSNKELFQALRENQELRNENNRLKKYNEALKGYRDKRVKNYVKIAVEFAEENEILKEQQQRLQEASKAMLKEINEVNEELKVKTSKHSYNNQVAKRRTENLKALYNRLNKEEQTK